MDKRSFLILIMMMLTYLAIAVGVSVFWILIEQLVDGQVYVQKADSIIGIILTLSLIMNFEYFILLKKGPRAWFQIRAFGSLNEETWEIKK